MATAAMLEINNSTRCTV